MWMFLRCVGKKPTLSLSHSVCSDVLLLHLFLKSAYLLLCCDLFFPALSQSMHSATGNKFDLGSVPAQSLFCTILTYIVYALSYFPQEAHFCIKKKIGLSLSPCSAAAPSKESQCQRLGSSWCHRAQLEKTQGLTASCTLDSLSTFARAQCKCQGAQALHSPLLLILNCFNLMSAGALQETLDFEYCQHL